MRTIATAVLSAILCASSLTAWAALPPPPSAGYTAETFAFACIGNGCALTPPVGDQLFVQAIHDADPIPDDPNIYFKFWNLVGTPSSVVQASVQGVGGVSLLGSTGVNFGPATNTPLPGGNAAFPPFVADVSFVAIPGGGINSATDDLELVTSSMTFAQVLAGIQSGAVRFGLFVTDFPGVEVPATYLNSSQPVPEPATGMVLAAGLVVALGTLARRRMQDWTATARRRVRA